MGRYTEEGKKLLEAIGGQENIKVVNHCVTRMRFELIDEQKVDKQVVENLSLVKGIVQQSGQFQVIIGNEVSAFYQDFMALLEDKTIDTNEDTKQVNLLQKLMANLGGIFAPIIPAIICGGLVIGLKNIIDSVNLINHGSQTLAQFSPTLSSLAQMLGLIGNAVFFFMPVAIVWSIVKKMQGSEILGIVLGITLITPTSLINNQSLIMGPFKWLVTSYQSEVIPAILAGLVFVYLERGFKKITPVSISMLIVPFCSIVLAVIATHLLLAPLGSLIGYYLSNGLQFLFTSPISYIVAILFGSGYMFLVMSGMHHITTLLDLQLICSVGGTMLWPMIALANVAQGSATLAMAYLQRNNQERKKINVSACISCYLGVSEPALFGVNKKYGFPFICAIIGSGVAAMFVVSQNVMAASIGVGGLPGIFSILPKYMPAYLIGIIIAVVVSVVLTLIVGQLKLKHENNSFLMPMQGNLMNLDQVQDQVFSQRLMGDGFAVELNDYYVYAPFDGEVIMTFPTGHAYGLKSQDGLEVLIHIGMDTVQLEGKGFESLVNAGDKITKGDKLVKVDLDYIRLQSKSLVSPVIMTSGEKIKLRDITYVKALAKDCIEIIKE